MIAWLQYFVNYYYRVVLIRIDIRLMAWGMSLLAKLRFERVEVAEVLVGRSRGRSKACPLHFAVM